jgi:sulfite exporter TauE/SafE
MDVYPTIPLHGGLTAAGSVELTAFLLIGLLGGAHCLGMCGPLVTMYADRFGGRDDADRPGQSRVSFYEARQHMLFNVGRTVSYAAFGGLFGLAGALMYDAASVVLLVGDVVRATFGTAVGVVVVATGVRYVRGGYGGIGVAAGLPVLGRFTGAFRWLQSRIDGWVDGPGIVGLGVIHGLLPCPLIYPAYLYAFARGSPVAGVVTLAVLGLGTIPSLFVYGTVVGSVDPASRERIHRALGVAFVLLGLMPIAHGLSLFGVPVPHVDPPIYQPLTG